MLTQNINNPKLAWMPSELTPANLQVNLSSDVLEELLSINADALSKNVTTQFPLLNAALTTACNSHLDQGYGAFIISGQQLTELPEIAQATVYLLIAKALGTLQGQNQAQDLIVTVRDEKQRMGQGGRYHKSNEGGELHTDAPQYEIPPNYVGLRCVRPASMGGVSKLVSAYSIHNALLEEFADLLPFLYDPYHFHQKPSTRTIQAPIFSWSPEHNALYTRYLGEYVRSGHQVANSPLSVGQTNALAVLDELLADEQRFALQFDLCAGDIFIFNNNRLFHGRSAFVDTPNTLGRELTRVWIKK